MARPEWGDVWYSRPALLGFLVLLLRQQELSTAAGICAGEALPAPVALTVHLKDADVVGEAVEQRADDLIPSVAEPCRTVVHIQ